MPALSVAPREQSSSHSHYQQFRWETRALIAAEFFIFWGGRPSLAPHLPFMLTPHCPAFFPFPPLPVAPFSAFWLPPFPSLLSRPCAALTRSPVLLPFAEELCWPAEPCRGRWQSDTLAALRAAFPLRCQGTLSASCKAVELLSCCCMVFCFIMAPFHTPVQLTYPTVFLSS